MNTSNWLRHLWRYGIIGIASNVLCYLVFLLLILAGMAPVHATVLCYLLGVAISYHGNRQWAFRSTNAHRVDILRFAAAYVLGFGFSAAAMSKLQHLIVPAIAQVVVVVTTAILLFVCLKLFGFGHARSTNPDRENS